MLLSSKSTIASRTCIIGSQRIHTKSQPRRLTVRCADSADKDKQRKLVGDIEAQLKKSGMTPADADKVLAAWQERTGHQVSPEDLRKLLVGESSKILAYTLVSTLLDVGAAYGAYVAGNYFDASTQQYGWLAVVGLAISWTVTGYFAFGVIADIGRIGALVVATLTYRVNAPAFLEAVESIAGSSGLTTLDKATAAVNSVKVLAALDKMSTLLKESVGSSNTNGNGGGSEMLEDLGAYLTLEMAQRNYGFDAAKFGLSDAQAAEIAVVFSRYDVNSDGVLSQDEFKRLCNQCAPDLEEGEVKAAFDALDKNSDKSIGFDEFVAFWTKDVMPSAAAASSS